MNVFVNKVNWKGGRGASRQRGASGGEGAPPPSGASSALLHARLPSLLSLSRWTVTPPEGKIGETVEHMCSEMHAKYGADKKVVLRISGRDYVTGRLRTVCSEPMRLESVTYDLIGQLVADDWHLKPKDAVFELTLL